MTEDDVLTASPHLYNPSQPEPDCETLANDPTPGAERAVPGALRPQLAAPMSDDTPPQRFLTEEEARAWLKARGIEISDAIWAHWRKKGYLFGVRKYNRAMIRFHWKGVLALLWRIELDDLAGSGPTSDDSSEE